MPGKIAITQPRRIAAISIAKWVSEETDTNLGEYIGYSIRFQEMTCSKTQMIFQTDGMLIWALMNDNYLT